MDLSGWFSLGVCHVFAVRSQLGLESSDGLTGWISNVIPSLICLVSQLGRLEQQEAGCGSLSMLPLQVASSYKAWQSLTWQLASSRVSVSGDPGEGCKIYYDPILEVTEHPFYCVLLIKKQITGTAQVKSK